MALARIKASHTHTHSVQPVAVSVLIWSAYTGVHAVKWSITNGMKFMTNCDRANQPRSVDGLCLSLTSFALMWNVGNLENSFLFPQVNSWTTSKYICESENIELFFFHIFFQSCFSPSEEWEGLRSHVPHFCVLSAIHLHLFSLCHKAAQVFRSNRTNLLTSAAALL